MCVAQRWLYGLYIKQPFCILGQPIKFLGTSDIIAAQGILDHRSETYLTIVTPSIAMFVFPPHSTILYLELVALSADAAG